MKKHFYLLTLLLFTLFLSACSAFAAEPIKIGFVASLTGDYAAYGQAEANAAKMATDEINAKGGILGRKIELITYDCRSRPEDTVNAVRRLIEKDKVVAIGGPNFSGAHISASPLVTKAKVPMVATFATNPLVTVDKGNVKPYNFRICFTEPYQGSLLAVLAAKDFKKMKGAVLYDVGSDYSQGLREYCVRDYEKQGGKILKDLGFRAGDVDFRAQLTEIKNSGANVLFLPVMGKEGALIVKQAREMGMKDLLMMGGDGYGDFMHEIAGAALVGTYWIQHVAPDDPAIGHILKDYEKIYKDECKEYANATLAYDTVYWIADAIKRAGKADGPAIAKALNDTKNLKLTHATITIDPKTHTPMNKEGVALKVDKPGRVVFYKKVKPLD